jgi:biopolymer transport protein ExbD
VPVHPAGPRLYSSISFKHLAQVHGKGGRALNIALNITPFVDMMTILVTFLLMVFSASGDILVSQKGLELPDATNKDLLRRAPVIIVARDAITFNNEMMADPVGIMNDNSPQWKVPELYERLVAERQAFEVNMRKLSNSDPEKKKCLEEKEDPKPEELCLRGLAILQADKQTPAKVLNRVFMTAKAADYRNLLFAVNRKGPGQ